MKRFGLIYTMVCIVLIVGLTGTFTACDLSFFPPGEEEQEEEDASGDGQEEGEETEEETGQYIHHLGVKFAPYDSVSGRAGAFVFSDRIEKPILEFGENTIGKAGVVSAKDNPTFEYHLHPEAEIFALTEGVVDHLQLQEETEDYVLRTRLPGSGLEVVYDHVTNPRFVLGDTVATGDIIGNPGHWEPGHVGRTEIQVSTGDDDENNFRSHCPFDVFDPDSLEVYTARVSRLIEDWESFKNDTTIYDEESFVYPCCVNLSIVP